MTLRGRGRECAAIDGVLTSARQGRSGVLFVRGAPGIGKSALLEYATKSAEGFQLVRASGVESEMELPFSGLQQLCAPLLEGLSELPVPQRVALGTAFGLEEGNPPDPLFVGLGALSLMSAAGSAEPLLCVVDDVQWLDRASAQALGVVARRLDVDAVALLLAGRDSEKVKELSAIEELRLEGLGDADARALLETVLAGRVDEQVVERIIIETDGNPLALLELPRGLTPRELAGGFGLLEKLGLSGRIQESFRRRLDDLPSDTRAFLLVAAAEPAGDAALLWRACELLGIEPEAATPAESAGLIRIGTRIRFFHPLVRSAVTAAASVGERRRSHAALADATDATVDPDRRAWHRAEAAVGPDESVAAELERSADRARARGGVAAAAAFLERSVELTLDSDSRSRRALAAAEAMTASGAVDSALDLVATAEAGALDELQQAQAARLRAQVLRLRTDGTEGALELAKAAQLLEPLDLDAALETYVETLDTVVTSSAHNAEIGPLLARLPVSEPPTPRQLLVHGHGIVWSEGFPHGTDVIAEAVDRYCAGEPLADESAIELGIAAVAAGNFWDAAAQRLLSSRGLEIARRSGSPTLVEEALYKVATASLDAGRIEEATAAFDEAAALRSAMGLPPGYEDLGYVAILRGDEETAQRRLAEMLARLGPGADEVWSDWASLLLAVLYNGLGRFPEAFAAAKRASDQHPAGGVGRMFAELIEAAARCGQHAVAEAALQKLAFRTQLGGNDWGLGVEARCRALLSDGDEAERLYLEAIERLDRAEVPLPLARAHLVYGEWLRRRRRRAVAREHLGRAYEICDELGAGAFAQRARNELAATGVTAHSRRQANLDELTPQEARIAKLASEGHSNAEIAAQLYITASTVDYHLKKVFRKLDVHSRTQLHRATAFSTT